MKAQWELATSRMRQSTLRAQGEDSYALLTAEMSHPPEQTFVVNIWKDTFV